MTGVASRARTSAVALAFALLAPSVARGQDAGLASWIGRYEFSGTMGERSMEGVIELMAGEIEDSIVGELRLGALPPAEVLSAHLADPTEPRTVTLDLRLPEGPGTAVLTLGDDDAVTGEIRVGPNVIPLQGRKVRSGPPPAIDSFLTSVRSRVGAMAAQALEEQGEPGLAVAAVEGDGRWVAGYGTREFGTDQPVTGETMFQVGSISKVLTAWGVMRLVDAGRIELDAPVNRYLLRWMVPSGAFDADGVTVRRLLSHTAGLNVPSISGVDTAAAIPSLVEELDGRGRGDEWAVHIVQEPGTGFLYSGGGYMVLQLLVEDVTGRGFADYMQDEVLAPLGMTSSSFGWNETVAERVATPHSSIEERNRRHRLFAGVAGAGLYTTAEDLAAFLAAHFEGPHGEPAGRGVVAPSTLEAMTTADPVAESYGLGYEIYPLPDGSWAAGHGGSNVGWKANLIVLPKRKLGFAVVSNDDEGRARAAVVNVVRDILARML